MPGIVLILGLAVLVMVGLWVRRASAVISNAAFILAGVFLVLAVLAFLGWV